MRLVGARRRRRQLGVELVGLGPALRHHRGEVGAERVAPPLAGAGSRSRTRSCAVAPAASVSWYQKAHLVPWPAGLTVAAPLHDVIVDAVFGERGQRVSAEQPGDVGLVLAEQRVRRRAVRAVRGEQFHRADERVGQASRAVSGRRQLAGALVGVLASQDQVLRNHAVGSTCSCASSGPALVTSMVIRMSSGPALA